MRVKGVPANNRARSVRFSVSFYIWKETRGITLHALLFFHWISSFPCFSPNFCTPLAPHSVSFWTCAARQNDRRVTSGGRPPRQALHPCVHQHYCSPGVCCGNMASPPRCPSIMIVHLLGLRKCESPLSALPRSFQLYIAEHAAPVTG